MIFFFINIDWYVNKKNKNLSHDLTFYDLTCTFIHTFIVSYDYVLFLIVFLLASKCTKA